MIDEPFQGEECFYDIGYLLVKETWILNVLKWMC